MPKRIPEGIGEEISKLYNNGKGLSPAEIARQTGITYSTIYGMTMVRQRINPETGERFASRTEYQELSDLIKKRLKEIGRNQSWLAKETGITRQAVSIYTKGKGLPDGDLLRKLFSLLKSHIKH